MTQILSSSHTVEFTLAVHWHIGGVVELSQVSALSRQSSASRQEQAGWPGSSVRFTHTLSSSHTMELLLAVHWHNGGIVESSQASALSRQSTASRHEHFGCPANVVKFRQVLGASHGGPSPQVHKAGTAVVLQVSVVLGQ